MTDAEKLVISERRDKFWQAVAILAAYGKLSRDQVLMAGLAQVWSGPSDSDVADVVAQARACAEPEIMRNNTVFNTEGVGFVPTGALNNFENNR